MNILTNGIIREDLWVKEFWSLGDRITLVAFYNLAADGLPARSASHKRTEKLARWLV